jgi:hypothetical protein
MDGEVIAAILFAAGRYNAFNFLSRNGNDEDRDSAVEFYVSEYRKALVSNLEGVVSQCVIYGANEGHLVFDTSGRIQ